MSTTASNLGQERSSSIAKAIGAGAIAGLGGGLVFGIMMGMMGMLPMVGMLIGVQNAVVGFILHMAISAFIGATFGAIVTWVPAAREHLVVAGGTYGIVWWVLGALILMPLMLGMTGMVLAIGGPQWMSLVGHIIYGVITGLLFEPVARRL